MRKSIELDHLLENAVAVALDLQKPHPESPRKIKTARRKASPHARRVAASPARHERTRVAA